MPSKKIVCLANSSKHNLRCVAGREYYAPSVFGGWIRPVNPPPERGIHLADCTYQNQVTAKAMDIIQISFHGADNHPYQSENMVINTAYYWIKSGQINLNHLAQMVENPPSLWETGCSSYSGVNDRVAQGLLVGPRQTLYLIHPQDVEFRVKAEGSAFGDPKRKVRAFFNYNGTHYGLAVTDLQVEAHYLALNDGTYSNDEVSYFTVSMTELFNGYAYKVVAAVF